ncbi:glycosyltransferase [Siccirubricoccus sp. G192]|nr:glycosyltransferase [Siccirubricoccus sp. G192]
MTAGTEPDLRAIRVSVIIPAYNAARSLPRTIDSVLAQTVPPAEIIVVDDGSADETAAVAEAYGDRVRVIRKPNGGPASARNLGAREATGEWLALLDADDQWLPEKLERQLPYTRPPEVGLVHALICQQPMNVPLRLTFEDLWDRNWICNSHRARAAQRLHGAWRLRRDARTHLGRGLQPVDPPGREPVADRPLPRATDPLCPRHRHFLEFRALPQGVAVQPHPARPGARPAGAAGAGEDGRHLSWLRARGRVRAGPSPGPAPAPARAALPPEPGERSAAGHRLPAGGAAQQPTDPAAGDQPLPGAGSPR